jgi:hypothetical protein
VDILDLKERKIMSDHQPTTRPKVPTGVLGALTTEQMSATKSGFVGYKTIWDTVQQEVPYETPKKP